MDAVFTLAWQHAVGLVFPEDLPMAAAELLAAGEDSSALCDLAGRGRGEPTAELDQLLREALAELDVPRPDSGLAERCLLRHLAAGVVAGELTAKEAAGRAWLGMGETATDVEWQFAEAVLRNCCSSCLLELETDNAEAYRAWEQEVSAAAATLAAAASDNPLRWSRRR
ncbi:hypothetical protein ACGF12_28310 [Kitasatospora sp. NPDC048296]|uniref:hypothetical protein n=1 Tax=Kitasatospora sp. NPDC048296 TaxID=3364048 RepID=UPI00371934FE